MLDIQNENHCDAIYYDLAIWRRFPITPLERGYNRKLWEKRKRSPDGDPGHTNAEVFSRRNLNVQSPHALAIPKDLGLRFTYDLEKGMHVLVTTSAKENKQEAKRSVAEAAVEAVFAGNRASLSWSELRKRIMEITEVSDSTAERRITDWLKLGLIVADQKMYRRK